MLPALSTAVAPRCGHPREQSSLVSPLTVQSNGKNQREIDLAADLDISTIWRNNRTTCRQTKTRRQRPIRAEESNKTRDRSSKDQKGMAEKTSYP
eukprot:3392663-Pleurochrysis_carterae.AAC.1